MIWFKIKRLEKLLAQGELSDITEFKYLLSHLLLWALLNNIPVNTPSVPLWSLYAKLLIALAAISWGISKTFKRSEEHTSELQSHS